MSVIAGLLSGCQNPMDPVPPAGNGVELTDQMRVGEYLISTFRKEYADGWVEITKAGKTVLRMDGWVFRIGTMSDVVDHDFRQWVGKDITGRGKPEIVIYEWTGGAHCEYIASVIELGSPCRRVAEINGQHSVPCFRDVDGDGLPEVIIRDWAYAYWPGSFGDSPAPQVILKWRNGKYGAAAELMRAPAPTGRKLASMAKQIRDEWCVETSNKYNRGLIPQSLFQTALDLMYKGHEALGWRFIAMAWNPKYPMDASLQKELKQRMRDSEWWQGIKSQMMIAPP